ncbi:MAG TPA: zf-HC2 domain-containing protein [Bryobacteraceae bacterium]
MICWSVKRRTHAYVDGKLGGLERGWIERHLRGCESCSAYFDQTASIRLALHRLPAQSAPAQLTARLRIVASQERQLLLEDDGSLWHAAWRRWKFRLDGFMRPLTIPATGGLLASIFLFGTLAVTIGDHIHPVGYDVPLFGVTQDRPTLVPVELRSAVVLTMSLDSSGHIADYAVRDNASSFVGSAANSRDSRISIPRFPSVFAAAQPVTSDISISFTPIVFRQ